MTWIIYYKPHYLVHKAHHSIMVYELFVRLVCITLLVQINIHHRHIINHLALLGLPANNPELKKKANR